jgi:hypothetical protein
VTSQQEHYTEGCDEITCPHCGHEHRDSWDHQLADGDSTEVTCDKCERDMLVTCCVSVSYTTQKLPTVTKLSEAQLAKWWSVGWQHVYLHCEEPLRYSRVREGLLKARARERAAEEKGGTHD